jgi:hypothetical protein
MSQPDNSHEGRNLPDSSLLYKGCRVEEVVKLDGHGKRRWRGRDGAIAIARREATCKIKIFHCLFEALKKGEGGRCQYWHVANSTFGQKMSTSTGTLTFVNLFIAAIT